MPTYAYVCQSCQHEFDAFQSIKAKPLRECPQCGRATLKRLIGSGAGIIFKGSGFYCTDYRSDTYTKSAKADTGGSGGKAAEKKPETKSETTPQGKTEAKEPKKKSA